MNVEIEYLMSFLQDELSGLSRVRVRAVQKSGIERANDLVQDYDPELSDLHTKEGVRVTVGSREYFFPRNWVSGNEFGRISELAREVRQYAES